MYLKDVTLKLQSSLQDNRALTEQVKRQEELQVLCVNKPILGPGAEARS